MKRVYKYKIEIFDTGIPVLVKMPKECTLLYFDIQQEIPCIWALIDHKQELEYRKFVMYVTGEDIENIESKNYIGTCHLKERILVYHLFEQY